MLAIIWRTLKDRRRTLFVYALASIALIWMYVATYPSVQATAQQVSQFVNSLPPELNKAFGLDSRSFTTFEGFIAGKHYSMVWPIMTVMLLSGFASSVIAGEIEKGYIELVLSQPISRLKIFLAKLSTGVIINAFFAITSVVSVVPIARFYDISFPANHFYLLSLIGLFFGLAIFGVSMVSSSLLSDRGGALFMAVGIVLIMYVVNIVAILNPDIEGIKYVSLFYYFDYSKILLDGAIGKIAIPILASVFCILSFAGAYQFTNRDITS